MTISIFPRASSANESKEPWSSFFTGMVASLKPTPKQASAAHPAATATAADAQTDQSSSSSSASIPSYPPVNTDGDHDQSSVSSTVAQTTRIIDEHDDLTHPPAKRRKLLGSLPASSTTPRPSAELHRTRPDTHADSITPSGISNSVEGERRASTRSLADPRATEKKDDKRSLRSHNDGTRLKSELAIYFPFYDGIMNDQHEQTDFLNADSVLVIEKSYPNSSLPMSPAKNPANPSEAMITTNYVNLPPASRIQKDFPTVDLPKAPQTIKHSTDDPLDDEYYLKNHKRRERREKQLRNIEKERAMHEKVQLERILAGLEGHDWLRVLGITGVTDSEARRYEVKRAFFIDEVRCLVDKFKRWKEEEKRLKAIKDASAETMATEMDAEALIQNEHQNEHENENGNDNEEASIAEHDQNRGGKRPKRQRKVSDNSPSQARASKAQDKAMNPRDHVPAKLLLPEVAFTSFFSKPYLRAAALGMQRTGRSTTLAFGRPIPDLAQRDFVLPPDLTTPDALRESARRRRRIRRESVMNAKSR